MTNKHGKISIKGLIIIVSLFLGATLFILLGVYLSYTSNKTKIVGETLTTMSDTLTSIIDKNEKFYLDNNFNIESNINSYVKLDETNKDIKNYIEFLNNISKIKTNIRITQDEENSKLIYTINSKKNSENYINIKYLIKDSTGYYYNDYITNKYINVGNNNYFETIKEDTTTRDNINYLKSITIESLSDNLANKYAKQTRTDVEYNNIYVKANKLEIELDNKKINELHKSLIKNLKNDKKSISLLENYIEGFKDKKIKNKKYLDKNETITINIYTKGLTNKFIKLEIIKKHNKIENKISYEKINNNRIKIYKMSNNNIDYEVDINKIDDNHYNGKVFNENKKNIGSIVFNKTEKETMLDISINDNKKRLDIDYKVNYKTIKEKTYNEDIRLDLKYLNKNNNVLTFSTEIENNITTDNSIKEDTSESILEKKLTEEQHAKKDQFIDNKLKDILGGLYEDKK